ncbi:zinc finger, CCHC-type containing protein [Tanacetum coccineum]|uniref:Zinc finger, CCHC-type containing protein n=1 Tax=Tanacetum coccineum TaxID=301880 RepID=A0ABQ5D9Y3_9ASTR
MRLFMYADIFTKGLPAALFLEFRFSLNVRRPPVSTAEAILATRTRKQEERCEPIKEISNSNPFDVLNSVENDVDLGNNGGTSNLTSKEANHSGSSIGNVETSSPNTTPTVDNNEKFKKLIIDGQATLVNNEGNPLKKVKYQGNHDSENEVESVNNDIARFLASMRVGFGTKSLLEQWRILMRILITTMTHPNLLNWKWYDVVVISDDDKDLLAFILKIFFGIHPWAIMDNFNFNASLCTEDSSSVSSSETIVTREFKECVDMIEIDCVMANDAFISLFSNCYEISEPHCISDHYPVVLKIPWVEKAKPRPFKFSNYIAIKKEFKDIVNEGWMT